MLSAQANVLDLIEGANLGTLTKSQMEVVTCFAPGRVNAASYVSSRKLAAV